MANLVRTDSIEEALKTGCVSPATPSTEDGASLCNSPRSTDGSVSTESCEVESHVIPSSFGELLCVARGNDFDGIHGKVIIVSVPNDEGHEATSNLPELKGNFAQKQKAWDSTFKNERPLAASNLCTATTTVPELGPPESNHALYTGSCMRYHHTEEDTFCLLSHAAAGLRPLPDAAMSSGHMLSQRVNSERDAVNQSSAGMAAFYPPKARAVSSFAHAKGCARGHEMDSVGSICPEVSTSPKNSTPPCNGPVPFVQRRSEARGLKEDQRRFISVPVTTLAAASVVTESKLAIPSFAQKRLASRFLEDLSVMAF